MIAASVLAAATSSEGEAVLGTVEGAALLLGLAVVVALAARRMNIPYSVALVIVGFAVSIVAPELGQRVAVTPELVLLVFLPGLVFEASYQLNVRELRRSFGWIVILAAPGVLVSAAVVAFVLTVATGLPIELAFVVGAIVSATDPVAVVALFRRLRTPDRLATMVEAESLFNDGTAIVVFVIAVGAIQTATSPADAIGSFVVTVVASVLIGGGAGLAASWVVARVNDHLIELTLSLVLAYGTYLVADQLHESGVIATVVAGVVFGTLGRGWGMSTKTQEAIDLVWEFIAFILNALVFLLIGLTITVGALSGVAITIAWGVVAILIGRALVIYGLLGVPARVAHLVAGVPAIPIPWLHVMFWSGLRGAVAVALALSLPVDIPQRPLLQGTVYGIVLFTLIVQGSTAEWVIRKTGVRGAEAVPVAPGAAPAVDPADAGTAVSREHDPAPLVRSSGPEV